MSQTDEVVLALGAAVTDLEMRLKKQEETLKSLSKWLTVAFREMGFDFAKIAQIESSRRQEEIQNDIDIIIDPDEMDPDVQDKIARQILKTMPKRDGQP